MSKHFWHSKYVYLEGDENIFLRKNLRSLTKLIENKYQIKKHFFIRYWEEGFHIRYRICIPEHHHALLDEINSFIDDHFLRPGKGFSVRKITNINYEPEIERYGGLELLKIAESAFNKSSAAVLKMLATNKDYNPLAASLIMNLIFMLNMGLDMHQTRTFFNSYFHNWKQNSLILLQSQNSHFTEDELIKLFTHSLETNKTDIMSITSEVLFSFQRKYFELKWQQYWFIKSKNIADEYSKHISPLALTDFACKDRTGYVVMDSLVHMNNNRLGLPSYEDALLGFLISKSI